MSRAVALIAILALVAVAYAAPAKWYIEEEWSYGTGCSEKKATDLKAYDAYRSGVCSKNGNWYYKYTCPDDATSTVAKYLGRCDDAACTNCTDVSDMNLAECVEKKSSFKVKSYRCANGFTDGQDGLVTIRYSDDTCKEAATRSFSFANNYCASYQIPTTPVGNYSYKIECGAADIKYYDCENSLKCEGCTIKTYNVDKCDLGTKYLCGSGTAGAATIVISVAFIVFAAITALVTMF